MYLIYIDESGDVKRSAGNTRHFVVSALMIPAELWGDNFTKVKEFRKELKKQYGMYMRKELHATDFIAGRGELGAAIVTKYQRSRIFIQTLGFTASLPGISIINVCLENSTGNILETAFNRLLNRVEKSLLVYDTQGILIVDEGKEKEVIKIVRKMHVFNPTPSKYGGWEGGVKTKNLALKQLIEDPFFKPSNASYFLQLVDFIAFSCLRREEPTKNILKYGLEKSFELLKPVLNMKASSNDPFGIVRG